MVFWVFRGSWEVLDGLSKSLEGEDITYWVGTLISRANDWVLRSWRALKVRDRGPTLQAVAENVESRTRVHCRRHGAGVKRITYAESGLQCTVSNTGLGASRRKIKYCGTGRFGSSSSGGGDSYEWFERFGDWETFAKRGVDEVKEVGVWECSVEVHNLGCVDY